VVLIGLMKLSLDFVDVLRDRARRREIQNANSPWLAENPDSSATPHLDSWNFHPPEGTS